MRPDRTFCQDVPVKRGESSCLKTGFKTVRQKTRCNLVLLFWWIYRAEAFSLFLLPHLQKTNLFTQQENLISTPVGHNREHKPHTPDRNSVSTCAALLSRKTQTQTQIWQDLVQFTAVAALPNPKKSDLKGVLQGWMDRNMVTLTQECKWLQMVRTNNQCNSSMLWVNRIEEDWSDISSGLQLVYSHQRAEIVLSSSLWSYQVCTQGTTTTLVEPKLDRELEDLEFTCGWKYRRVVTALHMHTHTYICYKPFLKNFFPIKTLWAVYWHSFTIKGVEFMQKWREAHGHPGLRPTSQHVLI